MKLLYISLVIIFLYSCQKSQIKNNPEIQLNINEQIAILNSAWRENDFGLIKKYFKPSTQEECQNENCTFHILYENNLKFDKLTVLHSQNRINKIIFSPMDNGKIVLSDLKKILNIQDWKRQRLESKIDHVIDYKFIDYNTDQKISIGLTPRKLNEKIEYISWGPRSNKYEADDLFIW